MNSEVIIKDGNLFFGTHQVQGLWESIDIVVPKLYVIRCWSESMKYWRFVCGLDLINDMFWLGANSSKFYDNGNRLSIPSAYYDYFRQVEYVLNNLVDETAGNKWAVFQEGDLVPQQDD